MSDAWAGTPSSGAEFERTVLPHLDGMVRLARFLLRVALMPMPGSYGANISLPEKGRYAVTVTIDRPGQPVRVAFEFDYK